MSADVLRTHWTAPARHRRIMDTLALALPLVLATAVIGWRLAGPSVAGLLVIVGFAVAFIVARQRAARHDLAWLIRSLDATRPELEDSSALLFGDNASLSRLQSLQRTRIAARLDQASPQDLAPAWSKRLLLILSLLATALIAGALLWSHAGEEPPALAPSSEGLPARPGVPRLIAQNLRIIPPAYTGLPVRDSASLDARVPQGSRLEWTLRFDPQASAPRLLMLA
ncbi:MAG TPA: DUF4175 domain-containing protein, partial [Sphingobium sp.]|nr:DUF4175 domain-containing protein [Sphingobium sp.]